MNTAKRRASTTKLDNMYSVQEMREIRGIIRRKKTSTKLQNQTWQAFKKIIFN